MAAGVARFDWSAEVVRSQAMLAQCMPSGADEAGLDAGDNVKSSFIGSGPRAAVTGLGLTFRVERGQGRSGC